MSQNYITMHTCNIYRPILGQIHPPTPTNYGPLSPNGSFQSPYALICSKRFVLELHTLDFFFLSPIYLRLDCMVLCDLPWFPHTIVICPFCVGDHIKMLLLSIRLDVDNFFSPNLPPKHLTIGKKFG